MIVLAFYISHVAKSEWISAFIHHLESLEMHRHDILPIFLPSSEVKEGSCKVECIYPRFAFEYEEKEAIDIREIVDKLQERIRMGVN